MVLTSKHDQHPAISRAPDTTDDDDIVRAELARRAEFDRRHRKAMSRLFLRPEPREEDQACQRQRIAAVAAEEITRRFEFDEEHPGIYKTAEERRQAFLVFHPGPLVDRLFGSSALKVADSDG